MIRAIELARAVEGHTSPNPPVGAVLVRDGEIVGEGSTQPPGGPHAEIVALEAAGLRCRGATLFVTLEPCSHWGRTPPCADAIIRSGVASVSAAVLDPNPAVAGEGVQRLRASGIQVHVGEGAGEASPLIYAHAKYVVTGMPSVTLFKSGLSACLQRLVSTVDAVVQEAGTPDPLLANALRITRQQSIERAVSAERIPVVIADLRARIAGICPDTRTLPAQVWDWTGLLLELGRRQITSVLVPGRSNLEAPLLRLGLIDTVVVERSIDIPPGFEPRYESMQNERCIVADRVKVGTASFSAISGHGAGQLPRTD